MTEREGFAARWSRLKEDRRRDKKGAAPAEEEQEISLAAATGDDPAAPDTPAAIPDEDLPDPDSMDVKGDFSVFMQAGVSRALQRRALRRLWSLDPVFANVDGLVEYGDDFRDAAKQAGSLRESGHAARRLARALRGAEPPSEETPAAGQDEEKAAVAGEAAALPDEEEDEDHA